jgi:hypothetical protein
MGYDQTQRAKNRANESSTTRLLLSAAMLCVAWSVNGQPMVTGSTETRFSVSNVNQFKTDLNQGGDFDWYSFDAGLRVRHQINAAFNVGATVGYGYERWSWQNPAAFGGQAPWGNISTPSVGLSLEYAPKPGLRLGFSPSVEWAAEDGVGTASSAIYGAIFSATNTFSKTLTLGLGLGFFRELGENKVFPFLAINWQIADQWTLKNPLPAGPAGGAGLELAYQVNPQWTISAGGAYRNYRFRLNDSGPYAGGVGQNRLIPVFARVSYALTRATSIDFYAISAIGGNVQIESSDGTQTLNNSYDTGLGLAVNLSHRF